ncbi:heme o synthase [Oricola thermophila]|uniref:Protoheme IX farnesyltransferase n=1 Tax=Oricola thermophila TaxID=2742145 RepID=A0A6N1VD70_9HYPH|nr:heme o synthase [Oricola thermophila]QKV18876.1 protoheme IX farnesyltransferase [Oricola thermophila]
MALVDNIESNEVRVSEALPGDYFALLKPRVMSLVVFTAFVGMMIAPGEIHPLTAAIAILSIAVGGGASGALNMWYDADIDAVMSRTSKRPIPAGRITRGEALAFGLTLSAFAVMTLGILTNWAAGGLLAFTIFFYAVIYTMWLKRSTPQNIVIGGAAGAFPPMIGWAAVTGSVSLESVILFLIIFLWTPPHFWALALFKLRDYDMANVPMLPNVAGERHTKLQILIYSVVLASVAVLPWPLGFASPVYGAIAILLGANFLRHAWAVWRMEDGDATMVPAKKLFGFSLVYLAALFSVLLGEALVSRVMGW